MGEDKKKRGNPNLHKHGKKFSSDYQPENYRQGTKWLTDMLIKGMTKKKTIKIKGISEETGRETVIKVEQPTADIIVNALLRLAAGGHMKAIEMVFDKVEQPANNGGGEGSENDGIKERVVRLADGTVVPLL